MKHVFLSLIFVALSALISPAHTAEGQLIKVENAYVLATSPVQKNGAAFMSIQNLSQKDLKILSVEADVAERVEMHTHAMDGDIMMMREVESFDIPAEGVAMLKPMGDHIMFMGLKAPLEAGTTTFLTLTLGDESEIGVEVPVVLPADAPAMDMHHGHNHGHNHGHHEGHAH
ncbi:MAG: copper chaperone PCu(A)C [Pseudomonadota bacterium]